MVITFTWEAEVREVRGGDVFGDSADPRHMIFIIRHFRSMILNRATPLTIFTAAMRRAPTRTLRQRCVEFCLRAKHSARAYARSVCADALPSAATKPRRVEAQKASRENAKCPFDDEGRRSVARRCKV